MKKLFLTAFIVTIHFAGAQAQNLPIGNLSGNFSAIKAVDFFDEPEYSWMVKKGGPFYEFNREQKIPAYKKVLTILNDVTQHYVRINLTRLSTNEDVRDIDVFTRLYKKATKDLDNAETKQKILKAYFKD